MKVEFLLAQISAISKKYDLIYQKTGDYFNIFDIANIGADEVTICRVIYELINPKGSHYQGDSYLKLFVKYVLKMDFNERDYESVRVHREYVISNNRRIDLVIETEDKIIPIEVKIYAGDQQKQCYDYYQKAINSNVFYLTLDGHTPSDESAKGLKSIYKDKKEVIGYEKVRQISFENEVIIWITKCLEQQATIRISPIREILLQLLAVIRKLTNQMEVGKDMEIGNILSSTKENMKSAIEIENSLKNCKKEMIKKVLKAIENGINKEKLSNQYDYEFNDSKINNYYERKGSTYPGISFFCKSLSKPGVDLWFRIEIAYCIYAGFCTPLNDKFSEKQLSDEEIKITLPNFEPCVDGWWIYWEFLPIDDNNLSPNFKEFNEEYLNLFNEAQFNSFIDKSIMSIKNMLDNYKI